MVSTATSLEARPSPLRVWSLAMRPQTLPAAVAPVVIGCALAFADGFFHWGRAIAALLGAVLLQVGTNLVNDYADADHGADGAGRLGPARATARGWLARGAVRNGAAVAFGLAAGCGLYLAAEAGWPIVAIGLCSIAAGIGYTAGKVRYGYRGLGEPFVFVFFGLVATAATYWLHTGTVTPEVWLAAATVGSLASAILVVNNLRDRDTDAGCGKRTLAVRFGASFARVEYGVLLLAPFVVIAAGLGLGMLDVHWWAALLPVPVALVQLRGVVRRDGAMLNRHLGGTARVLLLFAVATSVGVAL